MSENMNKLLLSTDTLPNYGLDLVFELAKKAGFDGIDLALWKGFDAWNEKYVQRLAAKHEMPVYVVQTSAKLNAKELNKALDICGTTGADTITINAPKITDFKEYDFIIDNLGEYQEQNPALTFSIINPIDSNMFALPIPQYRFNNIVSIIKKYNFYLGFDVVNMDMDDFEDNFMRKLDDFVSYISVIYLSDKNRAGKGHILPGDGTLKLPAFLKELKKSGYNRHFSVKLELSKLELADEEKVLMTLQKVKEYYKVHFENAEME